MTGDLLPEHWRDKTRSVDFFDLKGAVEEILNRLGINMPVYTGADKPWCLPGQVASIIVLDQELGWLGSIHPETLASFGLERTVFAAELDMDRVTELATLQTDFVSPPRYPAVQRDLAVIVSAECSAAQVKAVIVEAGGDLVRDVTLFDLYQGKQVTQGGRSLAFAITYRDPQRTLNDEEVNVLHQRIEAALVERLGVELRR